MRKVQELIGLPVVDKNTGKQLGSVKDVTFELDQKTGDDWFINGFLIQPRGLLRKGKWLGREQVEAFGEDSLLVKEPVTYSDVPEETASFFSGAKRVYGKEVMTEFGSELGQVEDVYFVEGVGKIIGYELSEGFLADLREGRKVYRDLKLEAVGEKLMMTERKRAYQDETALLHKHIINDKYKNRHENEVNKKPETDRKKSKI